MKKISHHSTVRKGAGDALVEKGGRRDGGGGGGGGGSGEGGTHNSSRVT